MKSRLIGLLGVCVLVSPAVVVAGDPGTTTFEFSFTADGGSIGDADSGIGGFNFFPLTMADPDIASIVSIELVITGLTHPNPTDLDIILIDPFGRHRIEIMTDRGDMVGIVDMDLTFRDGATDLPPENVEITSGTFGPEGLLNGTDGGFSEFIGTSGGTNAWLLVIIDDDPDTSPGQQSFASFTLRGTAVPEPVTLSLLALGAVATLRRRRR